MSKNEVLSEIRKAMASYEKTVTTEYDGILGSLPDEFPLDAKEDFRQIRDNLLENNTHEELLKWLSISEARMNAEPGQIVGGHIPAPVLYQIEKLAVYKHYCQIAKSDGIQKVRKYLAKEVHRVHSAGGTKSATTRKKTAEENADHTVKIAKELLKAGKPRREIAAVIHRRTGRSVSQIRQDLKKHDI